MVESVRGALSPGSEEEQEICSTNHMEKDNSKIYLLSVVTQDLICFFSSIVPFKKSVECYVSDNIIYM